MNRASPTLSVGDLFSRVVDQDPVVLLGAGASVRSGVPTSSDLVRLGMRWIVAAAKGWTPDDPAIRASDVHAALLAEEWYRADIKQAELFPNVLDAVRPRERRREFLLDVLGGITTPSAGYQHLAELLRRRRLRTVLTTNFDNLLPLAFGAGGLVTIADQSQYGVISTNPTRPQLVYLHGTVEHYQDRILRDEVESLDPRLVERLVPLVRDHPVIVVGYRGSEPSVMRGLFLNNIAEAASFRHGIYWCVRVGTTEFHPNVRELERGVGRNFFIVQVDGFDELMSDLAARWMSRAPAVSGARSNAASQPATTEMPFELRPSQMAAREVDWNAVAPLLRSYAERVDLPAGSDPGSIQRVAHEAGLVVGDGGSAQLTIAGALLLGAPRSAAPGAWVNLRVDKKPPRAIDGTMWEQYEQLSAQLAALNRPIRMKGPRSSLAPPYPTAALKEVIANALVHRDYEADDPIEVSVSREEIVIRSPGGLEADLRRRLLRGQVTQDTPPDLLQRALALGERGTQLTGYRNRVLADLFYGTGLVDKAGSGLADAFQELEAIGGALRTEVTDDNAWFIARLLRRPAQLDELTATARPSTPTVLYELNALEVTALPDRIHSAPTKLRYGELRGKDLFALPPYVLYEERLITFSNLEEPGNPLRGYVDVTQLRSELTQSWDDEIRARRIVHLFNEILFRHLGRRGLNTDFKDRLAYYACRTSVARYVEYRSRAREKQRRRVSHWPGDVRRYCEHKAARFALERESGSWLLSIVPTFVFTRDGGRDRVIGREASSLATRASTEEYNDKVRFDLVFWSSVLCDGQPTAHLDAGGTTIELSARPIVTEVTPLHPNQAALAAGARV
ncbi:MAG: hypothetical protein E6J42_09730 [Chloroflexi bacterium]|nr:MAG: hypothetical protein E6J42_09730 [Chloroflexota bacterium]